MSILNQKRRKNIQTKKKDRLDKTILDMGISLHKDSKEFKV